MKPNKLSIKNTLKIFEVLKVINPGWKYSLELGGWVIGWDEEVGFITKVSEDRDKVYFQTSDGYSIVYEIDYITPILSWEEIEIIINKDYNLAIRAIYNTRNNKKYLCLIARRDSIIFEDQVKGEASTRQQAVEEAIIKLGEKITRVKKMERLENIKHGQLN